MGESTANLLISKIETNDDYVDNNVLLNAIKTMW